jgi:hypothetical protein
VKKTFKAPRASSSAVELDDVDSPCLSEIIFYVGGMCCINVTHLQIKISFIIIQYHSLSFIIIHYHSTLPHIPQPTLLPSRWGYLTPINNKKNFFVLVPKLCHVNVASADEEDEEEDEATRASAA